MAFGWDDLAMAVAPSIIGGLFGGGGGGESFPHQEGIVQRMVALYDQQMSQYKNLNLEKMDANTVSTYRNTINNNANRILKSYDGSLLSMGRDPSKFDTETTRQRGMIADDASKQVATLQSELDQSRPGRDRSMMPNAGILGMAAGSAGNIDNGNNAIHQGQNDAMGHFASILGEAVKGGLFGGSKTGSNINGASGSNGSQGVVTPRGNANMLNQDPSTYMGKWGKTGTSKYNIPIMKVAY